MIKSLDPSDLGENHQVLAYGYQMRGNNVEIFLYDPNHPNMDNLKMSFNAFTTAERIVVTHNIKEAPIYCFFRTNYSFKKPPIDGFSLRVFANSHNYDPQFGFRRFTPKITNFRALIN